MTGFNSDTLQKLLEKAEYTFSGPDLTGKEGVFEIFLGTDFKDRELLMEARVQPQALTPENQGSYISLIFFLKLPFKAKDFTVPDVARTVAFYNSQLDFPCFVFNEVEGEVSFKYVWLGEEKGVNESLIEALIGLCLFHSDVLAPDMERVASGETTLNELLEKGLGALLDQDQA